MKITAVFIPFFLATASLSPVKNYPQLTSETDQNLSVNVCILTNITLNSLNSTLLSNRLKEIERNQQKISISTNPAMRCALKISKNQATGQFNFDYNSIPIMSCLNQNSVICNTDSNCSTALKCCNQSLLCTNAISITPIPIDQLSNSTDKICSYTNKTSCYTLEQINIQNYTVPTQRNSEVSLLAANPAAYIYMALLKTFVYLNFIANN